MSDRHHMLLVASLSGLSSVLGAADDGNHLLTKARVTVSKLKPYRKRFKGDLQGTLSVLLPQSNNESILMYIYLI